ncbi:MAG TPA: ATP-binding protein [Actinomycetota bacterium]
MRMRLGFIRRRRGDGRLDVLSAARRIRAHLDGEAVLRATAGEIERSYPGSSVDVWLTTGRQRPTRAMPPGGAGDEVPRAVTLCARRRRPIANAGSIAVPIFAPRGGMLGVVRCLGIDAAASGTSDLATFAVEAGYALETANLYEQAVAERDKSDAILSRVGDAVVVTDAGGRIRAWNRGAQRTIGPAAEEVMDGSCAGVLGLRLGERELDCAGGCPLLAVRSHDAALGIDVWRPRADGRRQPLLADVSAVMDANGNVSEVVHSLRDVTRLKEADEAKTMFLATASHELRTPLTVIQGFGQTLLTLPDLDGETRDRALQAMVGRSRQLNKIVDRLLLSSRIEAGRSEVRPVPVDLSPLVRERALSLTEATGVHIETIFDQAESNAMADPDAVATILDHLLENAVKYSEGKGVCVSVVAAETHVTVNVSDQGIGMDDEQAARCFEKFWQAESSDVRRFGGTGIGLFIVRSLVEAMRGKVGVTSAPGKGSTFWFRLPVPGHVEAAAAGAPGTAPGIGERSITREFMRQLGIPLRREP